MIFPKVAAGLLFVLSASYASEPKSIGSDGILIYRAETPKAAWNGWGYSSPLDPDLKKKGWASYYQIIDTRKASRRPGFTRAG